MKNLVLPSLALATYVISALLTAAPSLATSVTTDLDTHSSKVDTHTTSILDANNLAKNNLDTHTKCELEAGNLKADYTVTTRRGFTPGNSTEISLLRYNNTVAHQYPQVGITETWTMVRNKLIKPVRYFDKHERAIEYQPGESIHGRVEKDFSFRYQLISNTLLNKMTLERSEGKGCMKIEYLTYQNSKVDMTLAWLPELKLIQQFRVNEKNTTREWSLVSVDDNVNLEAFFESRDKYKATDYADIGDDHTDPFLTNMVNQGFIEAGASGFYDQNGNAIGEGHRH
jgi:hypothetical protein